jgi:hypothetical protein
MARWTARRRGSRSTAIDEEVEARDVKDESEDESELRLEVEVLLAWEHGGEGEGEGGGETASDKVSLGIGPNRACCDGVR